MLRKMMQSQLLGLFDHEKKAEGADVSPGPADTPDPAADSAAPLLTDMAATADTPDTAAAEQGDEPAADSPPPTIPNPAEP